MKRSFVLQGLQQQVKIETGSANLEGELILPGGSKGIVVFVHGSGSSRLSPRNQFVARTLQEGGLGTLLFDLLTPQEEQVDMLTRQLRFNIDLLVQRTIGAADWLARQHFNGDHRVGFFGASTGAAAALIASARRPRLIRAVVSRGGRPDLAGQALTEVKAPTLLLVGGLDRQVIDLNRQAIQQLPSVTTSSLMVIPGASHLFEEPGKLDEVSRLAREWFKTNLEADNQSGS